jgi:antitoxin CcdA
MALRGVFDLGAPKKAANLSVNGDLLAKAKKFKINLSSVLEQALAERVAQAERELWLAENADSISSYNDHVEKFGLFGDSSRTF